ncbi:DMT family transporter [Hominiventricola aquisgranensis]|uniref:DMT family transporter n=1 Tax=Hominiventricola aquisgranensis TaxID=3133164 RepID=A0ABV1I2I6_9FIRM
MKNNILLVLTALIWGCAFVAQSVGMDYVGPFTFNMARFLIGAIVLLPVIWFMDRQRKTGAEKGAGQKTLIIGGICCGIALAVASTLQQWGILFTTVGKAGFITAMYIVIVPLLGIFIGKKVRLLIIGCVAIAVVGFYFLCMTESLRLGLGDFLVLLCAIAFSIHILVIDHFSPKVDGVKMSAIQFLTAAIISAVPTLLWEQPVFTEILQAWQPVLYAGVMSCGVAYTLQIIAQKNADPTVASLLLSLESVFSVLAGWVLLGQGLSLKELFGCVLIFCAIILAQLPEKKAV